VALIAVTLAGGCGESTPNSSTGGSGAASRGAVDSAGKSSGGAASSGEKLASEGDATTKPFDPNALDLRTLSQIEKSKFTIRTANRLEGTTGDAASAIFEHYRSALEKLGWKLSAPPAKGQVTEESASGQFDKGDETIFLSIVPFIIPNDKATDPNGTPVVTEKAALRQFTVDNLGTCDSSKLPRLPGAEPGYASKMSSVYFTDMKVAATAASVKNLLVANGWQPFTKPFSITPAMPDRVRQQFRKEGNSLRVLVSLKPGKDNTSAVEYMIGAIGHQLPAPSDATDVEFDDAMCRMFCNVPRDIDPVAKYYVVAMRALGFEVGDFAMDPGRTFIICKSKDQDIYIDLNYIGINTRVDLHGFLPGDRKKASEQTKKP
jgi:hypothetical protein